MPDALINTPLPIFKFQVYFTDEGDLPIAGMTKMNGLTRKVEAIDFRTAGHPKNSASKIPGGSSFEPVTFEQGLGLDDGRFEDWALSVSNWKEGAGAHDAAAFRRDVRVDVLDLRGEPQITYILSGAWVSEYKPVPELAADNLNTLGIASFTVQIEGWYRQE